MRLSRPWRMVLLCAVAQNCAMGITFAAFGPLMASTEAHFKVSRATASVGMSVLLLAISLLSPLAGSLLRRRSVRGMMIAGAAAGAVGYAGLAFAPSFAVALPMYGLIGATVCLTAIIPPATLISRWFPTGRARALSIMNLPIFLLATPFVVAHLLPIYGRTALLSGLSVIFLLLVPLLLLIQERSAAEQRLPVADALPAATLVRSPGFWLLSLVIGILAGAGVIFVVHIVPYGVSLGGTAGQAAGLLSVYAAAGLLGTLLFGWLADRIGPPAAMAAACFGAGSLWLGMLHVSGGMLYLLAALIGVCSVPLTTLHGAGASALFGVENVSRVMGFGYLIKLPFLFGAPPLAGYLFDRSGHYRLPFTVTATALIVCGLGAFAMKALSQRTRQ